jgi:predicted HicB family RNase H-like nuclease
MLRMWGSDDDQGGARRTNSRLSGRQRPAQTQSTASVDPELHEAAMTAIRASGLSTSDWLAEAILLKLEVESTLGRHAG